MLDFYTLIGAFAGFALYDLAKYIVSRFKRRWGENPSDATYPKDRS